MEAADVQSVQSSLKTALKIKYQRLREGDPINTVLPSRLCYKANDGYPDIQQHEFSIVDKSNLHTWMVCKTVPLADIINCDCKHGSNQRTVITSGVCGVGKTTLVQSFTLDWAEGNGHQDIDFLFPFSFWEFNLIKHKVSLCELIQMFYPNVKLFDASFLSESNVYFVFDGLDEYLSSLDFKCPTVSDIFKSGTVDTLLTNLIKGNLFPNAHLWITTRNAAAAKIPDCYLLKKTLLQGFDDEQKELQMRTVIGSDRLTRKAINHVKISRSLDFLCQIPPVCTIMAIALKNLLKEDDDFKITPLTLTQMYSEIIKMANSEFISKLKKLARHQFEGLDCSVLYQDDLLRNKISVQEASDFSKEHPLVLREEKGLYNTTVFRFGHLSVQEFLVAESTLDEIGPLASISIWFVDQELESKEGKYDVCLRFLFGLIKEKGLMEPSHSLFICIKKKILENLFHRNTVVLFHCLREFDLQASHRELNIFMNIGFSPFDNVYPLQWTVLSQMHTTFEGTREIFNMPVSMRCDEQLLKKLPVVWKSEKAMLRFCNLTSKCCPALASILNTRESYLRELDLGYNNITDAGVKMLVEGMTDPRCNLRKLKLPCCGVTAQGCRYLAKALKTCWQLKELDLSSNDLGDKGLGHLADGLKKLDCHLGELKISQCNFGQKGCYSLAAALQKNPHHMKTLNLAINEIGDKGANELFNRFDISRLTKLEINCCGITMLSCKNIGEALKSESSDLVELNLSNNQLTDAGFGLICAGMYAWSRLEKLNVWKCGITTSGCFFIAKVLACISQLYSDGKPQTELQAAELRELDLSMNSLGDAGVKEIASGLINPFSHFNSLNLSHCNLTDDCCTDLASVLASERCMIGELDLSDNDIRDKGTKKLCEGLRSPHCTLEKLALTNCGLGSSSVPYLTAALKSNPNYLTELLLMGNKLTNANIRQLIGLTKKKEYALHTIE